MKTRLIQIEGDLLKSKCQIIFHQANCQNVMGGGIAKQIKEQFPEAYEADKHCAYPQETRLGKYSVARSNGKVIVNLYGQYGFGKGRHTDYDALESALCLFFEHEKKARDKYGKYLENVSYGIPYKMGCGLGGGNWDVVSKILEDVAEKYDITFNVYKFQSGE